VAMPRVETSGYPRAVASRPAPAAASAPVANEVVAPIASAVFPSEMLATDVEVRPVAQKPSIFVEPETPRYEEPEEEEFLPPAPEQPTYLRPTRMPQLEDLPPVAQTQLRSLRGDPAPAAPAAETRRKTLLEKLAAFGLNRTEEAEPAPPVRLAQPAALSKPSAASAALHAEYAPRSSRSALPRAAQGQLDPQGRVASRPVSDDDQLEIPAFLRRQAGP
jgi:cell division protein FtsZ